ncbi:NID2 [Bugula neritina]|uniref:NID2 n=1 Tax=Bugula neritina TaxID=10212 RepID=A0A7J7JE01_BUGNE|nr:NID2 [Bugula neritina]
MARIVVLLFLCLMVSSSYSDIVQCLGRTCSEHATCQFASRFFASCQCNPGFTGDGETCTDIDECLTKDTNNCHQNAVCINTEGSYRCECSSGFIGDGRNVCNDIKECYSHPCRGYNATCTDFDGGFSCTCPPGLTGDGISSCNDGVVCPDSSHVCSAHALCQYSPKLGIHCNCLPGFTGDGITCQDVDECAEDKHGCHINAACINTEGSFTCQCKHGFLGNGRTVCEGKLLLFNVLS